MFTLVFAVALLALSPKLWHTKVAAIAGILSALLTTAMIPGLEPGLPNTTGLQVVVALLRVVAVIFAIAAAVTKKTYVKDERLVWEAFVELAKSMRTWVVAIAVGLGLLGFDFLILWFGLPWG